MTTPYEMGVENGGLCREQEEWNPERPRKPTTEEWKTAFPEEAREWAEQEWIRGCEDGWKKEGIQIFMGNQMPRLIKKYISSKPADLLGFDGEGPVTDDDVQQFLEIGEWFFLYGEDLASGVVGPFSSMEDALEHNDFLKKRGEACAENAQVLTYQEAYDKNPNIAFTPKEDRERELP